MWTRKGIAVNDTAAVHFLRQVTSPSSVPAIAIAVVRSARAVQANRHPRAQALLAVCYQHGRGVPVRCVRARGRVRARAWPCVRACVCAFV